MSRPKKKKRRWPPGLEPGATCSFCGAFLGPTEATWEHVIPRWLQRRLGLWGQTYEVNGPRGERVDRRYDLLRIPACSQCNSALNEAIEQPMLAHYEARSLPSPELAALWATKVHYGFTALDTRLPAVPGSADLRRLMPPDILREFELERTVLRNLGTFQVEFRPPDWSSVFLYETQTDPDRPGRNFDYVDDPYGGFCAIRLGSIGIAVFLLDAGVVKNGPDTRLHIAQGAQPLNGMQFREVAAIGKAIAVTLRSSPAEFSVFPNLQREVLEIDLERHWDEVAGVGPSETSIRMLLAHSWGLPENEVERDGLFLTSLVNDDGTPRKLNFDEAVHLPQERKADGLTNTD